MHNAVLVPRSVAPTLNTTRITNNSTGIFENNPRQTPHIKIGGVIIKRFLERCLDLEKRSQK
tara:strand:- start:79 stop:264 length:186 start_codon:yes stop_codon:yes gene_type:complete